MELKKMYKRIVNTTYILNNNNIELESHLVFFFFKFFFLKIIKFSKN